MTTASDAPITALLADRDWPGLAAHLVAYPPAAIADVLDDRDDQERLQLFRALPRTDAAKAFAYLPHRQRQALLRDLSREESHTLLGCLPPDDRTRVLADLAPTAVEGYLTTLSPQELEQTQRLLRYPPDSCGRLMTPEVVAVQPEWTIEEAFAHLRRVAHEAETLDVVYVVDADGRLIDDLRLPILVLADPAATVASVMDHTFVALHAADDRQDAVRAMRRHDRVALPVVDGTGRLAGVITVDDVLQVAEHEATVDIQKLGGNEALGAPYMTIGLVSMVRKRAGWLAALFLGEMLTATAMGYFEDEIARAVVLALFVPLIISSGGNSGSQATSLIIRAMALGEVTLRDWTRVVTRELPTGLILGSILGLIGLARILLWQVVGLTDYGAFYLRVAATVTLSLIGVVTFGTLTGSLLPFLLRKLHFDPASASAPFVATLVDVTGLVIYFTVAKLVLRGALL